MTSTEYKEPSDMTPSELIASFEGDIIYDAHSYKARFGRSPARKELERRGLAVLQEIIDHLQEKPPDDFMDLRTAWGNLFAKIENNIGVNRTNQSPNLLKDTDGWIDWAVRTLAANQ